MVAAPSLEQVARTVVNHIERCREDIATAEQMLDVLRTRHDIQIPVLERRSDLEAVQLAMEKLDVGPGDVVIVRPGPDLSMDEQVRLRSLVLGVLDAACVDRVGVLVVGPDVKLSVDRSHG